MLNKQIFRFGIRIKPFFKFKYLSEDKRLKKRMLLGLSLNFFFQFSFYF